MIGQRIVRHGNMVSGNVLLGIFTGIVLEWVNLLSGGFTVTFGTFRLHHLWVGLGLMFLGGWLKAYFFVGLGALLALGDYYEHQRPDGTLAPFW